MAEAVRPIEDIHDLLEVVRLEGFEIYELHGQALARDEDGFQEGFTIKVALNVATDFLRTRFVLRFEAAQAEYVVDMAARYALDAEVLCPQPIAVEFAERVAVMAVYPYLREHVYNLASRLGQAIPVLGVLQQGEFQLSNDDDDDVPDVVEYEASESAESSRGESYRVFLMDDGVPLGKTTVVANHNGDLPEKLSDPISDGGDPLPGIFTLDRVNNAAHLAHYEIED